MIDSVLHLKLISVNFKHTANLICSLFLSLHGHLCSIHMWTTGAHSSTQGKRACSAVVAPWSPKIMFFMELFCPAKCDLCSTCGSTPLFCTGQVPSCFATTVEPKMFSQFATTQSNNFSPYILSVKTAGQTMWKSALVVQRKGLWIDKLKISQFRNTEHLLNTCVRTTPTHWEIIKKINEEMFTFMHNLFLFCIRCLYLHWEILETVFNDWK